MLIHYQQSDKQYNETGVDIHSEVISNDLDDVADNGIVDDSGYDEDNMFGYNG